MSADRPIGERVAALESRVDQSTTDRRDIWDAVNELRPLPERLKNFDTKLDEIKRLCESKERRIEAGERRVSDLQERLNVAAGERNVVIGVIGLIGSVVGSLATWLVTHFLGPLIKS